MRPVFFFLATAGYAAAAGGASCSESIDPGAGWPSKAVFNAEATGVYYSPRSLDYSSSHPFYSPYVTVFPGASDNRWWTDSNCDGASCTGVYVKYDMGAVKKVCKLDFENVS